LPCEPTPPLFPYTTLFRSIGTAVAIPIVTGRRRLHRRGMRECISTTVAIPIVAACPTRRSDAAGEQEHLHHGAGGEHLEHGAGRSEEHTSELQSPYDLVCR